jgi:hypothetical protein
VFSWDTLFANLPELSKQDAVLNCNASYHKSEQIVAAVDEAIENAKK